VLNKVKLREQRESALGGRRRGSLSSPSAY
jgi:hypothetical protein